MERYLQQMLNRFLRRWMHIGINTGIDHLSRGGKAAKDLTPAERKQAEQARDLTRKAQKMARMARRLGR